MIEAVLQREARVDVASASLAILDTFRYVGCAVLQAKADLEAARLPERPAAHCDDAELRRVNTKRVRSQTLLGQVAIPDRTLRCEGCGGHLRPDDVTLGESANGEYADDVRSVFVPLDWWHLRQHVFAYAGVQRSDGARAEAWEDARMDGLMRDRVGAVLSGAKRTRARGARLAGLVLDVGTSQGRIGYGLPGSTGFAIGSGSVERACKHLVQTRFERAGMRWKCKGFDDALELRIGRVNDTLDGSWERARARRRSSTATPKRAPRCHRGRSPGTAWPRCRACP